MTRFLLPTLVLLFAFLAGSSALAHADYWLHLASGRLLASGQYRFGVDPFCYTTADIYWTNHAWLFDLASYSARSALGDSGVVLLQGLSAVTLALILLLMRTPDEPGWVSPLCIALTILAMSPRLVWRSDLFSLVLFACCLYTLVLLREDRLRLSWAVAGFLILCLLWANLDRWFLLGPLLAGMFWLGDRLDGSSPRIPWWLPLAAVAVCLINPHQHHIFQLPWELSPAVRSSPFAGDPRLTARFASPWQFQASGISVASIAYFVLLLISLLSFVPLRRRVPGWRLLVWGVMTLLSSLHLHLVPLFAVVAGPIAALNLGETLTYREGRFLRLAPPLVLLSLIVCVYPGWLQARPHGSHRVRWAAVPDPTLVHTAQELGELAKTGRISSSARVFGTHPDLGCYVAWHRPGVRSFVDPRWALFLGVAGDFEQICRQLSPALGKDTSVGKVGAVFARHRIRHVAIYEPALEPLTKSLKRMLDTPEHWAIERFTGRGMIVRRLDLKAGDLPRSIDRWAARQVYLKSDLPEAPGAGPDPLPSRREWWRDLLWPGKSQSWESPAAALYLQSFEDRFPSHQRAGKREHLPGYAASLVGLPALRTNAPVMMALMVLPLWEPLLYMPHLQDRPPELLFLTVRAARLAIATNPRDALAWLRLGQAYQSLRTLTGERSSGRLIPLEALRHAQIAASLEQAVRLDPDLTLARRILVRLYGEKNYLDAALKHQQAIARLVRKTGPRPGETEKDFDRRVIIEETVAEKLDEAVQQRTNEYEVRRADLTGSPLARAELALRLGLALEALDGVLLRSDIILFGGNGARLQLELMLNLGRPDDARAILQEDEVKEYGWKLGLVELRAPLRPGYAPRHANYSVPAYEWLYFLTSAARGDYNEADRQLDALIKRQEKDLKTSEANLKKGLLKAIPVEVGLSAPPRMVLPLLLVRAERDRMTRLREELDFVTLQHADLNVLGGLLSLERGRPDAARDRFRRCLILERTAGVRAAAGVLAARYFRKLGPLLSR